MECIWEVDDKPRERQEPPDVTTIGNRKISAQRPLAALASRVGSAQEGGFAKLAV